MCLAVPGEIVQIAEESAFMRKGKVVFGGMYKEIHLTFVPEAQVGDYILVHAGFAISTIEKGEAKRVFAYLEQIDALNEQTLLEEAES